MPELDLGSVIGPQGPKGDKGIDGAVGPIGPQGEKGDDGAAASINGVNALTMTTGDGLEATMNGSAYHLKLTDNALNAVQAVPTFVRPNLLDNWYFGRPVDQRGGKIIQSGVNIYTDSTLKTLIGPAAYACPVVELTSTYAKVQDAKNTGSYYYAAPADVVRGYTGNGYTVDRWCTDINNGGAVLVGSNGITLTAQNMYWGQRLAREVVASLAGKTVTASVLMSDNNFFWGTVTISWQLNVIQTFFDTHLIRFYINQISNEPIAQFEFSTNAANVSIIAAKLELGPTQTLAHQDSAGKWVLNEVPEYGNELLECQRYCERTAWTVCLAVAITTTTIEFCGSYYFKVEKRVPPVITVSTPAQAATIYDTVANVYYTDIEVQQPTAFNTKMMAPKIYDSKGRFVVGRIYQVIVGDGQYLVSADL